MASKPSSADARPVFFFDIDNCLYARSTRVQDLMQDLIDDYFVRHLALPPEEAVNLHRRYYKEHGLAITGLVAHHQVDPIAYNREVDDALPLDNIIKPDTKLRQLLEDMDKTRVKLWLFTNAHITHGKRVVKLLGVDDMFEGITYCNYEQLPLVAKPHAKMFNKAEAEAGAASSDHCYFIDDSLLNCGHAKARGWTVVHKLELDDPDPVSPGGQYQIRDLEELRNIFPQFFKRTQRTDTKTSQKIPPSQL
ncbi:pyrimidine and pyridine-specific 5'-nucleotidase, partial [Lecanoromycetidae sp. Uapishka_2]